MMDCCSAALACHEKCHAGQGPTLGLTGASYCPVALLSICLPQCPLFRLEAEKATCNNSAPVVPCSQCMMFCSLRYQC